jgi:hypothetical protein
MISDRIEGTTPDSWTPVATIQKLLGLTAGVRNTGGSNSFNWRLRGKATDSGATMVLLGPGTIAPGASDLQTWNSPLWEATIEFQNTTPGSPTTGVLEYVATVEK